MGRSRQVFNLEPTTMLILPELRIKITLVITRINGIKGGSSVAFCVIKNDIVNSAKTLRVVMGAGSFPHNLIPEIFFPKNRVHHDFKVMASGRVAVQIDASR